MQGIEYVPLFISATSKDELIKKMQLNNAKLGAQVQYFDIQKDESEWVAWYYYKQDLLKGASNG